MKQYVLLISALVALLTSSGCASLGKGLAIAGGTAAGGLIADEISDGSTSSIILGSAIGAGVSAAAVDIISGSRSKKAAEEKAEIWEEGRRYEREAAAQQSWYAATLMPDLPQRKGAAKEAPRTVTVMAPQETVAGMRMMPRTTTEAVLP